MKVRALTHQVYVDGERIEVEGMALVYINEDNTFKITPFAGEEQHSTIFISGILNITTDKSGHVSCLYSKELNQKLTTGYDID